MELALHHVEEDGDGGFAQLRLGKERHFQHGADHFRDELDLVLTWNKETRYSEIGGGGELHSGLRWTNDAATVGCAVGCRRPGPERPFLTGWRLDRVQPSI